MCVIDRLSKQRDVIKKFETANDLIDLRSIFGRPASVLPQFLSRSHLSPIAPMERLGISVGSSSFKAISTHRTLTAVAK